MQPDYSPYSTNQKVRFPLEGEERNLSFVLNKKSFYERTN